MAQEKRYRVRRMFQLDLNNPEHVEIDDIIEWLKNDRAYSPAIRDGLRLIWELRQGKTDTLLELFPFVVQAVNNNPDSGGDDDDDLRSDIRVLQRQLADLTVMSHAPEGMLIAAQDQVGIPHLNAPDKPELVLIDEPIDADSTGEFLNMFDDFG